MRLAQCVDVVTGKTSAIPRAKPFKYTYEKEIVMYAYHKKLDYFATECVSSQQKTLTTYLISLWFPKRRIFSPKWSQNN